MKFKYFFFCFIVYSFSIFANPIDTYTAKAQQLGLGHHPQWHKLLHYRDTNVFSGLHSEVDDQKFFLSNTGASDPESELFALLSKYQNDQTLACQFPARIKWLNQQLQFSADDALFINCDDYNSWREEVGGNNLSLIFPAAYLNNPSSMFGHLFIRVDQQSVDDDSSLIAATINYGANVPESDGTATYTYKGLTGQYPGWVTVQPYYEKVKQYSDLESRDIWEYQIEFSDEQIDLFLSHIWELKEINFDYFFFDENCAYRILTLLEAVIPESTMSDNFPVYAIPSDVVRILNENNFLGKTKYRPSLTTQLKNDYDQLDRSAQKTFQNIVNEPSLIENTSAYEQLEDEEQQKLFYSLANYARNRLNNIESTQQRDDFARLAYVSLVKASQIESKVQLKAVQTPQIRDDEGHETFKVSLGSEYADDNWRSLISVRPAFHSLTDPVAGYLPGAQIEFLKTQLSYDENLELDQFVLLNIQSLIPVDPIQNRLSWGLDASFNRFYNQNDSLAYGQLQGNVGKSYEFLKGYGYFLATGSTLYSGAFNDNATVNLGAKVGYLHFGGSYQLNLSVEINENILSSDADQEKYQIEYSHHLNKDLNLNISAAKIEFNDQQDETIRVALDWFF